jgi:chromosome segregation protein
MRFSRLRLLGFKSFVDPTELVIADGLTGVVGPNGCGKSNLLEALRWVMGENRPKAMRGSGMEDVIFNGASSRPARNYAEVTLSLDNEERTAPPAFNSEDKIDIVRRITRDAGSAYKVLGKEARARDVQMLFADASTGAHSPALVRQGQISELVNAKPKSRRRVLEEAAGISGLYQRRHEAELKLNATLTNLARVDDILEQLATQLSSLARQAKQAARYREIANALRQSEGVLLYRRWAESDEALQLSRDALKAAVTAAAASQSEASKALTARQEAEEKVPPLREEEAIAAALYQRLTIERETIENERSRAVAQIETLDARLVQLKTDQERETSLSGDADEMIAQLEWETTAMAEAAEGYDGKVDAAKDAARLAMVALQEQESGLDQSTEDLARLEARHQSLARRLEDAQTLADKAAQDAQSATQALETAQTDLKDTKSRHLTAQDNLGDAQSRAEAAEKTLATAEIERTSAQAQEAETRAALAEAEGEAKAINAEANALERLLAREGRDGAAVIDDVRVTSGFETALGAALADDLKAPMIAPGINAGWAALDAYDNPPPLPDGATPLSEVINAPDVLTRRLTAIGLVDKSDGDRLQPMLAMGQRLVSRQGDLWRWDGLRANAEDTPTTSTLLLQQRNRLEELNRALDRSSTEADKARVAQEAAQSALETATQAERNAREARKAGDAALADAQRQVARFEADVSMLEGRIETLQHTLSRRNEDATQAAETKAASEREISGLDDLSERRDLIEATKITVASARAAMLEARGKADDLRREEEARIKRAQEITKELSGWKLRRDTAAQRLQEFADRITETTSELENAQTRPGEIDTRMASLSSALEDAQTRRTAASDALAVGETALRAAEDAARGAERHASEAREGRARAEALCEAAEAQRDAAAERIEEEMEVSPDQLLDTLAIDPAQMPSADKVEMDVARLRRQRDSLGAVNLRAEEDARDVEAEYDTLAAEKADLDQAVEKLQFGIESLNKEGRQRLLDAFDEVNRNFAQLFTHLFGGGDAKLVLVESDDPLEAGLEIMCQPPGKKLATLSLLSGGEQTLTALSLIFAVFLANPSPICVLDEVDAPLDDANVTRFCDLLDEMTRKTDTRFLIITHHAVTMSRMDRLFGVTMAEQGVSQLVSVDLKEAEKMVA